jgi:acyl carrier protein
MDIACEVVRVLDEVLSLNGRSASFTCATHLVGAVPEFDSMAVVSLLTALEERFGVVIDDDEIDGAIFETVGTLTNFVTGKLAG